VYRNRAEGIINSHPFQQFNSQDDQYSRDASKQHCAGRTDPVAGAGNCNQPGQKTVCGKAGIPLLGHQVAVDDRSETGSASSESCIGGDSADAYKIHGRERAPGIEPVPAKPKNEAATDGDSQIMRQHGPTPVALECAAQPWAENDRARQSDESANGMDHSRSSEIMEAHAQRWEDISSAAHVRQPAVRSPSPVSDDRVNETSDADAVEKVT